MKSNVFQFRRLKWGDPEHKLEMLLEPTPRPTNPPWIEIALIAFIVGALTIIVLQLM